MTAAPAARALTVIALAAVATSVACSDAPPTTGSPRAYELGTIGGFAELVHSGVKTLALSEVLSPADMDAMLPEAEKVAARNGVKLHRESSLLVTDLFPADVAKGKDVLLIYQGGTLDEYLALKAEAQALEQAGLYTGKAREAIARRFGRMLSYPSWRINQLLAQNTSFRTMRDFGIRASNLFWYYRDLRKATAFYRDTLGLELVADYEMATIFRVAEESLLILVDATKGMHTADEPKSVALALLTDQLDEWHTYLGSKGVSPRRPYAARPGSAHDGFVVQDPEGYLLEFERFNQHPENERVVPLLKANRTVRAPNSPLPAGLGIKATITWLYYTDMMKMQTFYEEVLGLRQVVDQGWAKVYEGSRTGHVGLVDERRGMNRWSETKAVNVSFLIDDIDGWFQAVKDRGLFPLRGTAVSDDEAGRYRAFTGFDPEGYFMEFDVFRDHPLNARLMPYLSAIPAPAK